jgi:hypothetical protein
MNSAAIGTKVREVRAAPASGQITVFLKEPLFPTEQESLCHWLCDQGFADQAVNNYGFRHLAVLVVNPPTAAQLRAIRFRCLSRWLLAMWASVVTAILLFILLR